MHNSVGSIVHGCCIQMQV